VRVPDEAGNGKAKVRISFEAWKVRPVLATTTEITVGEKPADGSDGLKAVPPAKSDR
jgi:hypothetical protein